MGALDSGVPNGSGADSGGGQTDWGPPHMSGALDPKLAPGGNFDLWVWELQEPVGAPTTIPPSQLVGPNGFQDKYFFTDPTDGSMSFWDPENGATTANSSYSRSELREMDPKGSAANWSTTSGTHRLSATVKATAIPDHVAVGQIHIGQGSPSSTKPLLELFYFASGAIELMIEQSPAGGNGIRHPITNVPLSTKWSYVTELSSGNTISLTVNGGTAQTWQMSPTYNQEGMYFKAGDYNQTSGSSSTVGAKVQFYALKVFHGP